jgi:hypothetical protein
MSQELQAGEVTLTQVTLSQVTVTQVTLSQVTVTQVTLSQVTGLHFGRFANGFKIK